MDEFYRAIEEKIQAAGYDNVDGRAIYEEICDEIEGKENGTYIFMKKQEDNVLFEYVVQVFDEEFNLSTLTITCDDKSILVDFDN